MAANIATIEPLEFAAGDTVKWTKSLEDYSAADGWALTYHLRGDTPLDISATQSGTGWSVTISATETAGLKPGTYSLTGRVTYSGETFTVYSGSVTVKANAALSDSIDARSHARKCLDALQGVMEKRCSLAEASYTIFGERGAQLTTIDEALKLLNYYKAQVRNEEIQERANRGERGGIQIRFLPAR